MYKIPYILILAFIAGLQSCGRNAANKTKDEPAIPVTVTTAQLSKAVFYNSYPANIVALKEIELRGQVNGYLTGIFFTEGKEVHTGQKLYEIDSRKYRAAYMVAQSNVRIAESILEKAQRDANRYNDLAKQDAIAIQLLDNAMTDLENAKQRLDAANSELIRAKTDYDYSIISAPFNGTIGFSSVKLGALINQGQTILSTLSSDDPMGVDFEISETEVARFQKLENTAVSKNDSTFKLALADNSLYPYTGKISVIDRAVNPRTGSVKIRITIPNREKILKPGMSCKVLVLNANAGMQILIPFKAVVEQMSEYFVFVIKDNHVEQVRISLGPRVNSNAIVLNGLSEGETIVLDGVQKLHDGSKITISQSGAQ
jgi:membrane fusion protein, multidrug efflux system